MTAIRYIEYWLTFGQDSPRQERAKAKKTDEIQPDDEEVEEFEVEETETRSSRPASKLDLEEPISSHGGDDYDKDDEEDTHEVVI